MNPKAFESLKGLWQWSGSVGTAACPVRKCFALKYPEQLSDGEGLQELIFPSLGFNQVLKRYSFK